MQRGPSILEVIARSEAGTRTRVKLQFPLYILSCHIQHLFVSIGVQNNYRTFINSHGRAKYLMSERFYSSILFSRSHARMCHSLVSFRTRYKDLPARDSDATYDTRCPAGVTAVGSRSHPSEYIVRGLAFHVDDFITRPTRLPRESKEHGVFGPPR